MADGNLGQDDIDRMLAEMGVGDAAPAAPAQTGKAAAAPAQTGKTAAAPAQTGKTVAASPAPAIPAAPAAPVAPAAPAAGTSPEPPGSTSGTLESAQIDALVAQATAASTRQPAGGMPVASGQLGQDEIDKLLADLDPMTRVQGGDGKPTGHLSQENIDKLLNDLNVPGAGDDSELLSATRAEEIQKKAAEKPGTKTTGKQGAASKTGVAATSKADVAATSKTDAAAASKTGAAAASKTGAMAVSGTSRTAATSTSSAEGPLSQDDVDKLLAQLGAGTASIGAEKSKPGTGAVSATAASQPAKPPTKAADQTAALSPDEIDRIVAKQNDAPVGSDSEAVIAQSDIDALVKQLASATGAPDGEDVVEAIAGKTAEIDRLQAEAGPAPSPELTADAVDVDGVLGRTTATAALPAAHKPTTAVAVPLSGVATVATIEWRLAGGFLIAAVLALTVCVGALIVLTGSVRDLSKEIRADREAEHPVVDGYADKLRLALAKLAETDESERARGVRWMEELKRQHPERASDVSLALARYFRSREAWRRASDEYAVALEAMGGLADDPRILLEEADCLSRLGDEVGAVRTIYALLAGEERWLAERTSDGRPVPDLQRNRQAVADAYLVLGRLLSRTPTMAARTASDTPPGTESSAKAPAAAAHAERGH